MTAVRYQPWALFDRLQHQLDQAISAESGQSADAADVSWIPQVDIREEPERFLVLADVPGVEPKDIHITADKGVLTIRGEKRVPEAPQREEPRRRNRGRVPPSPSA